MQANHLCTKCGNAWDQVDGSKVGGFPGITYWFCFSCGNSRAITHRLSKREMLKQLKPRKGGRS